MKKILSILVVIMVVSIVFNTASVLAFGNGFDYSQVPGNSNGSNLDKLKTPINKVANTVLLLLQVASVGGVIALGLKYMFTSADKRAEIKNGLIMVVIGLILVFSATTVAQYIINAYQELINK